LVAFQKPPVYRRSANTGAVGAFDPFSQERPALEGRLISTQAKGGARLVTGWKKMNVGGELDAQKRLRRREALSHHIKGRELPP